MWLMLLVMLVLLAATVAYVAPPLFTEKPGDEQRPPAPTGARRG